MSYCMYKRGGTLSASNEKHLKRLLTPHWEVQLDVILEVADYADRKKSSSRLHSFSITVTEYSRQGNL